MTKSFYELCIPMETMEEAQKMDSAFNSNRKIGNFNWSHVQCRGGVWCLMIRIPYKILVVEEK